MFTDTREMFAIGNTDLKCIRTNSVERRSGGIESVGLFARNDLQADEFIAIKGGRLIDRKTLLSNLRVTSQSHHQITPELFMSGLTPREVDATLIGYNHSCQPNAYIDGQISLRTLRQVNKDEEITVDYGTIFSTDTQAFECRCGHQSCRHRIQPSKDSSNHSIVGKYKGHLADFLTYREAYKVELKPIDSSCPKTSYINVKLKRIKAKIHGYGLTPTSIVSRGELIAVRGGTLTSKDEIVSNQDKINGTEVQVSDDLFLVGHTKQERLATMIGLNHGCLPNCHVRGQICIFAMGDIPPGEELTVDYATAYISPSQKFKCTCGAATCRKYIDTTTDWLKPDIRSLYKGYFASFIERKIDNKLL